MFGAAVVQIEFGFSYIALYLLEPYFIYPLTSEFLSAPLSEKNETASVFTLNSVFTSGHESTKKYNCTISKVFVYNYEFSSLQGVPGKQR